MEIAMMPSLSNGSFTPYGFVVQDPKVGGTVDQMMPSLAPIGTPVPFGISASIPTSAQPKATDPKVGGTVDVMMPALVPIGTPVPFGIPASIPTSAQPKATLHSSEAKETVARLPLQEKPSSSTTNQQLVHSGVQSVAVHPRVIMTFYLSLSFFL